MTDKFLLLSIRARVAFCLLSLENLFDNKSKRNSAFNYILDKFWSFTYEEDLSDWYDEIAEILPHIIMSYDRYVDVDFDYLNAKNFYEIKDFYENIDDSFKDMIYIISQIGSYDLYSRIIDNSPETIVFMNKFVETYLLYKSELPNINNFMSYTVKENDGWGLPFNKTDLLS